MKRTQRRWFATVALAAAVAAAAGIGASNASAESNGGVRVMPLGDSITEGTQVPGGYRIGLWQRFVNGGYKVDFVGSQSNGPASLGDHDHEGHPGWRIDQIDANIVGWLNTYQPHTVLLHIGTNDVLQNYNLASAPARLSTLIDHITATVPSAEVFVAQIIPLANANEESAVRTFNAAIPGIVAGKANSGKHVHLVDMHSVLTASDLTDGIHPTAAGYDKMAAAWYSSLLSVPGSIGAAGGPSPSPSSASPTTSPTAPPGTTPPTSAPPSGTARCTATYTVVNQWPGGFQASVQVTAVGAVISGWTVTWQYPNGQVITQAWNATVTTSGTNVTARNVSYNGGLAAGATTDFGVLGTTTGATAAPTPVCAAT